MSGEEAAASAGATTEGKSPAEVAGEGTAPRVAVERAAGRAAPALRRPRRR